MVNVMAFGTFDVFHKGHEHFLKQARKLGDSLIVVVSRDDNIRRLKGQKPVNSEEKRLEAISLKEYVDECMLGYHKDFFRVIVEKKPDIICLGYDQWISEKGLRDALEKRGMKNFKVVKAKAFKPKKYKSSLLKNKD
ncbi:adenylyltransferase/cytidyltransferase family protein [Bacteroidota bacterium]